MHRKFCLLIALSIFTCLVPLTKAQEIGERPVTNQEADELGSTIAELAEKNYISEATGKEISAFVRKQLKQGTYYGLSLKEFRIRVHEDLREVSSDSHMSLSFDKLASTPQVSGLSSRNSKYGELSNFGHTKVELLENNIGYLKVSHFTQQQFFEQAKKAVDSSIQMLGDQEAVIVDLRDNPGGFEEIVAYFVSYFVEGDARLQRYYCRFQDRERSISLSKNLPLPKLSQIPVFIVVNHNTGSAAESFAYIMKHLKRATVVGEVTVGGGNGANQFRVSDDLILQVATWETINEVTQTSWEKTGVTPHILSNSEDALTKAIELAVPAAKSYRAMRAEKHESALKQLNEVLDVESGSLAPDTLRKRLDACQEFGIVGEQQVNWLGYQLLADRQKLDLAEAAMAANVAYYPQSANVYDSYGDALMANQKYEMAASNFRMAVELGSKDNSEFLSTFRSNLAKAEAKLTRKTEAGESDNDDAEIEEIKDVLQHYIEGTANGETARLRQAFHPDFKLHFVKGGELAVWSGKDYIENIKEGQTSNRIGKIISIDRENEAAQAKVEVRMPDISRKYTDYFLLMKLKGKWTIIHKSFSYKTE